MENASGKSGGVGFLGLLGIALIVLRLTGHIDWPWWAVLAPIWGPIAIALSCCAIYVVADQLERRQGES